MVGEVAPLYCLFSGVYSQLLVSSLLLFPSLWLWAALFGNGLYFLPDGTLAAGNDCGRENVPCKGGQELVETGN